jgi:hypothetical protein
VQEGEKQSKRSKAKHSWKGIAKPREIMHHAGSTQFLMLLLCLGYVALMGVSLACTMWCFYGLNYAIACACLKGTSMLAPMKFITATIRGLSLLVTLNRPPEELHPQKSLAAHKRPRPRSTTYGFPGSFAGLLKLWM